MTQFERMRSMSIREMAEFFAIQKYPNFPTSPCYIWKGLFVVIPKFLVMMNLKFNYISLGLKASLLNKNQMKY